MRRFDQVVKVSAFFLLLLATTPGLWARVLEEPHQYVPENIEEYSWEEQESIIPPYPKEENLVEFDVDRSDSRYSFFIDTESLNIGKSDGVVRYTLVLKFTSGNRSVSFEGLKCSSREYKVLAVGGRNSSMRPTRRAQWRPIRRSGNNLYRRDLWEFYLCNDQSMPRSTKDRILDAIRFPFEDRKDVGFD